LPKKKQYRNLSTCPGHADRRDSTFRCRWGGGVGVGDGDGRLAAKSTASGRWHVCRRRFRPRQRPARQGACHACLAHTARQRHPKNWFAVPGRRTGGLLRLVSGDRWWLRRGCDGPIGGYAGSVDYWWRELHSPAPRLRLAHFFFICFGLMSSSSCAMPIRLQGKPIRRHTPQAHTIITGRMKETGF
jgi:hypothetical protein